MPTYAYGCDKCGVRFDRYQSYDDPPLTECPECGEDALRKLFTPIGVVFKGSGFYSTDHRSPSGQGSSRSRDESGSAGKDASDKGEAAKPVKETKETKPAATGPQDQDRSS
jgi:putative FmdB family regulatory protein